jgi:predicted trehalose synthase
MSKQTNDRQAAAQRRNGSHKTLLRFRADSHLGALGIRAAAAWCRLASSKPVDRTRELAADCWTTRMDSDAAKQTASSPERPAAVVSRVRSEMLKTFGFSL